MGIIWLDVCLISAHGLHHSTSLWKRQWFAVGWIDIDSKYCTKVDDSGSANPVWRTKFAIHVDDSVPNFQDLALNVEVYSIDTIFFKEKLHGSTKVALREFLVKKVKNSAVSKPRQEEVRSYQLLKKKSSKPRGKEGKVFLDDGDGNQLTKEGGVRQAYQQEPQASKHQPENHVQANVPDYHLVPFTTTSYYDTYVDEPSYYEVAGPSNGLPRTRTPPSPPPPSNVGYIPTFLPRNDGLPPSYPDMPPFLAASSQRVPPGVAMDIGAGALAAGALIFGDDFLSGFDVPPGLRDANLNQGMDPPF